MPFGAFNLGKVNALAKTKTKRVLGMKKTSKLPGQPKDQYLQALLGKG
jgi:hypothetical protein